MATPTPRLSSRLPGRSGPGQVRPAPTLVAVAVAAVTTLAVLAVLLVAGSGHQALAQSGPGTTTAAPTPDQTGVTTAGSTPSTVDPAVVSELRAGSEVFSQICSACHQPGGAGLSGRYPPLKGNPTVQDGAYVAGVIDNGKQGEITVLGTTYNGVMPSFSTLTDDDVTAVIAYLQNDFQVPAGVTAAPAGPVAGTELPGLTTMGSLVAYLLAAAVAGLVLAPRLLSTNDRLDVPWLDAGLKTATIVSAVILLTVVVPNWALRTSTVAKLSRFGQDVIAVGLFGAGLVAVLWALWYAQRESRV
jgi:mono/diheme cytochrome c family protein